MKKKVKICGFYKRLRDGSEFILFEQDSKLFLTNGVYIWGNQLKRIEARYLKELTEVEKIDLEKISEHLSKYFQHAAITKEIHNIWVNLRCEQPEATYERNHDQT